MPESRNPKLEAFKGVESARNRLLSVGPLVVEAYLKGETNIKPEWHPDYIEAELAYESAQAKLQALVLED